uniref:Phospholipase A2 homolog 1 n=1 Tax=Solanum lycopersicum TaxID=4081 RepID=A0A3Q7I4F7_SOLLC
MLHGDKSPMGKWVASSFILTILLFFSIAESTNNSQVRCSKTCVAENCNCMSSLSFTLLNSFSHNAYLIYFFFSAIGIRYGKYCGVGWSGCPGEKPCDDLDACCKIHDECVEKNGMTNVICHEKFKRCIKKVQKSGKAGFTRDCPYDVAVPTMVQGMDMAILFSQLGNSKLEL